MIRVIFVACPPERANDVASHLLSQRACACVSVVPGVESRYWWQGRLETAQESLLVIKCASEQVETVIENVREVHPYQIPEVIALPVEAGNPDYLSWVRGEMRDVAPFAARGDAAAAPRKQAAAAAKPATATKAAPAAKSAAKASGAVDPAVRSKIGGMKLILLGPPGVGKGTQARILAKRYGLKSISTGNLFLKAIRGGTQLGKEVEQYTMSGKLVPDGTTNIIVKKELAESRKSGYVLDGFPRTLAQAEALAETEDIDFVFYINAQQEVLIERLTKRFYCDCGDSYGPDHPPAVDGLCDSCGGMLYQREDDKPQNVLNRLEEYNSKTRELLRFYREKLHPIDGSDSVEEVTQQICEQLEA